MAIRKFFNGVCRYLKLEGVRNLDRSRGRIYMHDNTASRKSGHRTAYEDSDGSPLSHKVWAKNEAGSPKLGASTRARKERSIGSWDGKFKADCYKAKLLSAKYTSLKSILLYE